MPQLPDLLGQTLDGKYRLDAQLGQGGMGAVFRATHLGTDRVVALKVIAPALMDRSEFVQRFQREARAAGRLRHPNIVDLTDFGSAEVGGQRLAYLVMEFLEGESLAGLLARTPRPPLPFVVEVVQQVCSALQEAHDAGIIHRDLKPDNLWLEPDRRGGHRLKVLDFGLAKLYDPKARAEGRPGIPGGEATEALPAAPGPTEALPAGDRDPLRTEVGTRLGTPAYMSPEQCRGVALGPRSDLYSLGVIAYQMLSGQTPFQGGSLELLNAHVQLEVPSLREARGDLPPGLAELVMECLAKDPGRRPETAELLGNAFEAYATTGRRTLQQAVSLLLERWPEIWRLVRVPALLPLALLALTGAVAFAVELRLSPLERLSWFLPGFILALAGLFYLQGTLKGLLAPVVLIHTRFPLQPLQGAWAEAFLDRTRPMRRLVRINLALALGTAALVPPLFRLLDRLPSPDQAPGARVLAALLLLGTAGAFSGLWMWYLHRSGGSLAGSAPCAMLVEGLALRETAARMSELKRKVRARGHRQGLDEGYAALAFLVLASLGLIAGHGLLTGGQPFPLLRTVTYVAFLACGLLPVALLLAVLDAIGTNLLYFRMRMIARESLRDAYRDLRLRMES